MDVLLLVNIYLSFLHEVIFFGSYRQTFHLCTKGRSRLFLVHDSDMASQFTFQEFEFVHIWPTTVGGHVKTVKVNSDTSNYLLVQFQLFLEHLVYRDIHSKNKNNKI